MEQSIFELVGIYALRIGVAILVMLLGRFIAGRARALTKELLKRPQLDQALSATIEGIVVRVVYYGTLTIALIIALAVLGVPASAILSVSSAILVLLAIALRESLANFAATVIFMIYQPFSAGDEIETMGRRGFVREVQLFNTVLTLPDRSLAILPNGEIQESGLINYTRLGIQRVDLPFRLKYETDFEAARAVILEFMKADGRVLEAPPPNVVPLNLGPDGFEVQARPFVKYADYDPVQFDYRPLIVQKLREAGIELAVSQRNVTLNAAPPAGAALASDTQQTASISSS